MTHLWDNHRNLVSPCCTNIACRLGALRPTECCCRTCGKPSPTSDPLMTRYLAVESHDLQLAECHAVPKPLNSAHLIHVYVFMCIKSTQKHNNVHTDISQQSPVRFPSSLQYTSQCQDNPDLGRPDDIHLMNNWDVCAKHDDK